MPNASVRPPVEALSWKDAEYHFAKFRYPVEDASWQRAVPTAIEQSVCEFDRMMDAAEDHHSYKGPTGVGWILATRLKSHPELAGCTADEAVSRVDAYFDAASVGDWTEVLPDCDVWGAEVDPREHFRSAWDRVCPWQELDVGIQHAAWLADRVPVMQLPDDGGSQRDESYRRLLTLCYCMARLRFKDGLFYLSRRVAAAHLGCSDRNAGYLLGRALRDGYLEVATPGTKTLAATYRCLVYPVAAGSLSRRRAVNE